MSRKNQEHPKAVKWYIKLLWAVGIPLTIITAVLLWWMINPSQDISYSAGYTMKTTAEKYMPGDTVTVVSTGTFCNAGVDNYVERKIENAYGGVVLPPVFFFQPEKPTCVDNNTFKFVIPADIPHGHWKLSITNAYKPNPVRTVTISVSSNFFEVENDQVK